MRLQSLTRKTNRRLRHFVGDGVGASSCEGLAESNFNALATALSASAGQIGLVSSTQNLLSCWLQLWSEKLVGILGGRKRLVVLCVSLQSLLLAGMIVAAISGASVLVFMALVLAYTSLGGLSGCVWNSWVSELLPRRRVGVSFGIRQRRTYPLSFVSMLLAGLALQKIDQLLGGTAESIRYAFAAVFAAGLVAKLHSLSHLARQPEVKREYPARALGPIEFLIDSTRDPAIARTSWFFAVMGFGVAMSGPFQTPYMLQSLKFSYIQFSVVGATYVGARFLAATLMGRLMDSTGRSRMLQLSTFAMPLLPLCWALTTNFALILCVQFVGGFIWAAYDLSSFGVLANNNTSERRQRAFAAKSVAWGLASAGGAFIGGTVISAAGMPQLVFWLSFAVRVGAIALVMRLPSVDSQQPARAAI